MFFPVQRGLLEMFEGEIRDLASDPNLQLKFKEWSASRDQFLTRLQERDPSAVKQAWQRDYTLGSKEKKSHAQEFFRTEPVAASPDDPSVSAHRSGQERRDS
jgi:hypothetical protein